MLVYIGNVAGALGTVALVFLADVDSMGGGAVGETIASIGRAKSDLHPVSAFFLGILCNALVCLAVWLALGGRSVTDKILAIILPIAAFVTAGFEHSIANWFFLPYAIVLDGFSDTPMIVWSGINLAVVTVGNVIGGTLLVAGVYWLAYLRKEAG